MSINLSDLTSPNNQDVLAEITSAADFLDPIGKLENLSRSPNKGGPALQTVALNQPRALPLDANGKGYCYLPVTTGNAPAVTFPTIGANDDFVLEMVAYVVNSDEFHLVTGANANNRFLINYSFNTHFFDGYTQIPLTQLSSGLSTLTVERSSGLFQFKQNGVVKSSISNHSRSYNFSHLSFNGQFSTGAAPLNGYIQTTTLSIGGTEQLNIDFTATNSPRHGDTKFKCATGQVVTINQSGNDPATIIKKPVLRFDGVNSGLNGLFANNIDGGYMFAAFSVLGDGGADWGRVFTTNLVGSGTDYSGAGAGFSLRSADTTNLLTITQGLSQSMGGMFDAANGDILHEVKLEGSDFSSKVNNAGFLSATHSNTIDSDRFNIGQDFTQFVTQNGAIDLEFLALFSADSVPDEATASKIRNYINNRNNVFDLKDGFGYYFYDAQNAPVGNITDVDTWSGRIVGSDNGDSASIVAQQATANDQPVGDGYVVTFADNSDFLTIPSTTQAGWQVVGTSLGTFAYRVNSNAVTALHLLGNDAVADGTTYRKAGDLYGTLLLPTSATGRDIAETKKLLTDRGASEQAEGSNYYAAWYQRRDIIEFGPQTFPYATNFGYAWSTCISMSDFGAIKAPLGAAFQFAWKGCSFTSFPAGAKLGTSTSNVNFTSAWQSSGLTSFSTPLPTAGNLYRAWKDCDSLVEFNLQELPSAYGLGQSWAECAALTSFNTELPIMAIAARAWLNCSSLTEFSADVFANWDPQSISTGVFNLAWDGCTALTAQSVENILTSIDASGHFATTNKVSGGTPLADAGIDIDYDGTTLSAATNAAVTSLKSKGWVIVVNGVTL